MNKTAPAAWEDISRSGRMKVSVPGGWVLYTFHQAPIATTAVFVPDPRVYAPGDGTHMFTRDAYQKATDFDGI